MCENEKAYSGYTLEQTEEHVTAFHGKLMSIAPAGQAGVSINEFMRYMGVFGAVWAGA